MLRMEIALFLVMAMVACIYFTAEKEKTSLHRTFEVMLVTVMIHLIFDGITVYTVNHLDLVPKLLNDAFHRLFIGTMILIFFLFYQYISILVVEEAGEKSSLGKLPAVFLFVAELGNLLLPVHYAVTPAGNYSDGIHVVFCYLSLGFYFVLGSGMLLSNRKKIQKRRRIAIEIAIVVELVVTCLQGYNHTWLISGMGITLITLAFYLILENPDILRAEIVEQKMSMLYLKSQVNPHFLYNTLDTIRIQAQLNGDQKVADLLMDLVDFFRLSVKVDRPLVTLDDEMELLEAYMELMCYRYPELSCEYDIDPDLGGVSVPNFILQPMVENSLLHGLKNKGYKGEIKISAKTTPDRKLLIAIRDTGSGFAPGKKAIIDDMLENYSKQKSKLTGNSIGVLNVQKRIKLLCGREFGLSYTENEGGGVTANILLPLWEDERL